MASSRGGFYWDTAAKQPSVNFYINGTYQNAASSEIASLNTWYTYVATYNNEKITFYINGLKVDEISTTGDIKQINFPVTIGANPGGTSDSLKYGSFAYITVSDVLIFERALTKEEITQNYSGVPNPEDKTSSLLWYKFT